MTTTSCPASTKPRAKRSAATSAPARKGAQEAMQHLYRAACRVHLPYGTRTRNRPPLRRPRAPTSDAPPRRVFRPFDVLNRLVHDVRVCQTTYELLRLPFDLQDRGRRNPDEHGPMTRHT